MRILTATLLALAALGAGGAVDAQSVAGTYELALCRTASCAPGDTTTAYLTATVVLLDSAAAARHALPPARWQKEAANGCFRVRHYRQLTDSYAGIMREGRLHWRRPVAGASGALTFLLYRSPDASYGVQVSPATGGLAGWGTSDGIGVAEISGPRDTVVAVRVSEADPARCR